MKQSESNESNSIPNNNNNFNKIDLHMLLKHLTNPLYPFSNTHDNNERIDEETQQEQNERGSIRKALVKSISENVAELLSPNVKYNTSNVKKEKQKQKGIIVDKAACDYISNLLTENEYVQTNTLNLVKSQRDMFLSVPQRQHEEEQGYHQRIINVSNRFTRHVMKQNPPPKQPTALPYVLNAGNKYISTNLKSTVMPTVLNYPSPNGAMEKLSVDKLTVIIPSYQNALNDIARDRVLNFLTDDRWRKVVKDYTKGFILTKTSNTVGATSSNSTNNSAAT